jgi:hypothetical protein
MQISSAAHRSSAAPTPVGGTAGALQLMYGDTFTQLGAVDRGHVTSTRELDVRFASAREAAVAAALLEPSVDGVAVNVCLQNGRPANPDATTFSAIADAIAGLRGVNDARLTGDATPALQIDVADHDIAARLDWIFRDAIAGVPVRFLITTK